MTRYTITRPIMSRGELASYRTGSHGRNYYLSDDGYSDMEVAATEGWAAIAGWGADGWDLGDWPYLVISTRGAVELRQTVEGDTDLWAFPTRADRDAAIDYLFVWYGIGREYDEWGVHGLTSREALDAGTLRVPDRFRGPYRTT